MGVKRRRQERRAKQHKIDRLAREARRRVEEERIREYEEEVRDGNTASE